jgi:hypothetical protein
VSGAQEVDKMETGIAANGRVDRSVRPLFGENELREWLETQGFRCVEDPTRYRENECNWYAYRRSELEARRCECNDNKPGMQIVVKPSAMALNGTQHRSVDIELCGEAGAVWWKLSAYSLNPEQVPEALPYVENALIAAWNALRPNGNE